MGENTVISIEQCVLVHQALLEIASDADVLVREFYGTLVDLDPSLASNFTSGKACYETLKIHLMDFIRLLFEAVQDPTDRNHCIPLLTRHYLALGVKGSITSRSDRH
jgi:hypothetical protein